MKLRFTERADKDYAGLPVVIRKAFAKQLRFLLANRAHPSLRAILLHACISPGRHRAQGVGTDRKRMEAGLCQRRQPL